MELRTYPPYYPTSVEYDIFQGHALCSSCGHLLYFPVGSALVQCPICKTVLSLRPIYAMAVGGQTCCSGCHQNMLFPLGATVVQCTNCSSITHCPSLKNFTCRGCGLQLAYCASSDVTSVLCTVCNTLRDIVSIEMENFSLQYGHKRNVTCSQQESTSSIETISRAFHLSSLASDYDENGDELTQAPQPLQYEEEFTGSYKPANPSIHKET